MNPEAWKLYSDRLHSLKELEFNYDAEAFERSQGKHGWNTDKHKALLGCETPGEPSPHGLFARAQQKIRLYQFPNPRLIRAFFDPDSELSGRNMLLQARFMGLSFYFGVRVTAVFDEVRKDERGEPHKVWGYAYRTLKGHFEIGEIRFLVSKNLKSGEVFFEIDSYSKADRIPNPFFRAGFKIFGRQLQGYFARSSIARMKALNRES